MKNHEIPKIINKQLIISTDQEGLNIHDIAFLELISEEVRFHRYIFLMLLIFNMLLYFIIKTDFFLNVLVLFISIFLVKKNPLKWHLLITLKEFKYIKIPILKQQLQEAEKLIEEYKFQYQMIDKLNLKKNINHVDTII